MRLVFDTNVLVSALLLADSVPRQAFDRGRKQGRILISWATLAELHEVLGRHQFRKYVDEEDVRRFLAALTREADWVEITAHIAACRDPKDNKFLEVASSGRATHIITGDADLLSLSPFQGISILSAQRFLDLTLAPGP